MYFDVGGSSLFQYIVFHSVSLCHHQVIFICAHDMKNACVLQLFTGKIMVKIGQNMKKAKKNK